MKPRPPQQRRKTAVIAIIVAAVALAVVGIGLTRGFLLPGGPPRPALKATELTRANSGGAPAVDGPHDDQGARALAGLGIASCSKRTPFRRRTTPSSPPSRSQALSA